jgi:hypothetical protein
MSTFTVGYMAEFHGYVTRVCMALPRSVRAGRGA